LRKRQGGKFGNPNKIKFNYSQLFLIYIKHTRRMRCKYSTMLKVRQNAAVVVKFQMLRNGVKYKKQ